MHPQHMQSFRVLHLPHVTAIAGQVKGCVFKRALISKKTQRMQGSSYLHLFLVSKDVCLQTVAELMGNGGLQDVQGNFQDKNSQLK